MKMTKDENNEVEVINWNKKSKLQYHERIKFHGIKIQQNIKP